MGWIRTKGFKGQGLANKKGRTASRKVAMGEPLPKKLQGVGPYRQGWLDRCPRGSKMRFPATGLRQMGSNGQERADREGRFRGRQECRVKMGRRLTHPRGEGLLRKRAAPCRTSRRTRPSNRRTFEAKSKAQLALGEHAGTQCEGGTHRNAQGGDNPHGKGNSRMTQQGPFTTLAGGWRGQPRSTAGR
jgi:hypothetical protein